MTDVVASPDDSARLGGPRRGRPEPAELTGLTGLTARAGLPAIPRQAVPASPAGRRWHDADQARLLAADLTAALVAGALAAARHAAWSSAAAVLALAAAWVLVVVLLRGYETRFTSVGSEEFRRVGVAGLALTALVGTGAWAFDASVPRAPVLLALALTVSLSLAARWALRRRTHRRRARGLDRDRVLVVGHPEGLVWLTSTLARSPYHGMDVVAACLPQRAEAGRLAEVDVPVEGSFADVVRVAEALAVDTVVVLSCPELDAEALRRIGWGLEELGAELLVAPGVMEAVGPRVGIRPVCGVPLIHVEAPELRGSRRLAKAAFDRAVAAVALLVLSPVLLAVAVAVRFDSPGGALFRQRRVGVRGREFTMWKFRSMVTGADALVGELAEQDEGSGLLFKVRDDPRVTRVGRLLRKTSLDELPQLVNVLLGHMSLVGPRPPLPREVALYPGDVRRRLLVKPGVTGLWQVSGRSDLSWEESVRLDLRYVENWSFAYDLVILVRTASAVLFSHGAY
ncbi:sugar transferase [Motilibacter rhizosphaerae]|nr:sugar transferase [Motilibacter rhizosphaerae]